MLNLIKLTDMCRLHEIEHKHSNTNVSVAGPNNGCAARVQLRDVSNCLSQGSGTTTECE